MNQGDGYLPPHIPPFLFFSLLIRVVGSDKSHLLPWFHLPFDCLGNYQICVSDLDLFSEAPLSCIHLSVHRYLKHMSKITYLFD